MGLFDIFKKRKKPEQTERCTPKEDHSSLGFTIKASAPKPLAQAEFDDTIIPAEMRIEKAIASKQGLYPHEILVLSYAHTFYTDEDSFQRFWWTRYGVEDVKEVLGSLQERGFIQFGDLRTTLNKQAIADIKDILKANNCKTTGKKADLVQRALDELPESIIMECFPRRTYSLTEAGQLELDESAYIPYIHRNSVEDLDIWSLNRLVNTKPSMPYRDKIWGYLNKKSLRHVSKNDFGLYRNCRFTMAQLLIDEKKYQNALALLAEVVFCDLSGASNNYDAEMLHIFATSFFPYEKSLARTAPGIIKAIGDCQKELQLSDDELKAALIEQMNKLAMPLQLFTVEECAQIIFFEREQSIEELKNLYSKAKTVFEQQHPDIDVDDDMWRLS